ncbi:MAG: hypothetical protein JXD19_08430 [Deltaproteobacteria bacterium]|nr:hypothetical protein [Deltaproteobacteria bacterium]
MNIWEENPPGKKRFKYGQESYLLAAEAARHCSSFIGDDDDETVSNAYRSCYNCRYRRWTSDSFECLKS